MCTFTETIEVNGRPSVKSLSCRVLVNRSSQSTVRLLRRLKKVSGAGFRPRKDKKWPPHIKQACSRVGFSWPLNIGQLWRL